MDNKMVLPGHARHYKEGEKRGGEIGMKQTLESSIHVPKGSF
jgi:hypothetical protein